MASRIASEGYSQAFLEHGGQEGGLPEGSCASLITKHLKSRAVEISGHQSQYYKLV